MHHKHCNILIHDAIFITIMYPTVKSTPLARMSNAVIRRFLASASLVSHDHDRTVFLIDRGSSVRWRLDAKWSVYTRIQGLANVTFNVKFAHRGPYWRTNLKSKPGWTALIGYTVYSMNRILFWWRLKAFFEPLQLLNVHFSFDRLTTTARSVSKQWFLLAKMAVGFGEIKDLTNSSPTPALPQPPLLGCRPPSRRWRRQRLELPALWYAWWLLVAWWRRMIVMNHHWWCMMIHDSWLMTHGHHWWIIIFFECRLTTF